MPSKIFVSYSRREVGFVDDLVSRLEKLGHQVWLDYRSLIPGSSWEKQIELGVDQADVILLVVSKASLGSQYVEFEWRRVTQRKKRIILLVFEAVDLPPELENYEWVDFRGSFKKGLQELTFQLEQPVREEYKVPQMGFKIPFIVVVAIILSQIVAVLSLPTLWTLILPFLLVLLPYQIFKRNFNFVQVQAALLFLPLATFFTAVMIIDQARIERLIFVIGWSVPLAVLLVFILRSSAFQRWGKEQAIKPRFVNRYKLKNTIPDPMSFFIDHAPEDRYVAHQITRILQKYKHTPAENIAKAEVVFALVSAFKYETDANLEEQVVIPIILQSNEKVMSSKLSRIHWIDFRGGVRHLDAIAQLLNDPQNLMRALGIRPMGNLMIMPRAIMAMYYFLVILAVILLGSFFRLIIEIVNTFSKTAVINIFFHSLFVPYLVVVAIACALIYFLAQALNNRKGWFAKIGRFIFALSILGVLSLVMFGLGGYVTDLWQIHLKEATFAGNITAMPFIVYAVGMPLLAVFWAIQYKDIRSWFPAGKV